MESIRFVSHPEADFFLRRHRMHPEQTDLQDTIASARREMRRGLSGESSSMGMFPAYLRCGGRIEENVPVLAVDAGGTNLRAARLQYRNGQLVTEAVERARMPGTSGEIGAAAMFDTIAELLLPLSEGCERAAFCFSYPCEVLPDGDGLVLRLTKELHVRGLVGSRLCAPLEESLQRKGAGGQRRWRLLNDTVGSMLGGMAQGGSGYDDTIGFILGTGTNTCAPFAASSVAKSAAAMAMGGDVLVNLESGGFDRVLQGDADIRLDESSEVPGSQRFEKMISGAYLPVLLRRTFDLLSEDGLLSVSDAQALDAIQLDMPLVNILCGEVSAADPFSVLSADGRSLLCAVTQLLLDRAAKLSAAVLAAILFERGTYPGKRVCICTDGTTFRKNPLLRPRTESYLRGALKESGTEAVFFEVTDATLLGTALAGLSD